MSFGKYNSIQETIAYVILWVVLLLVPLLGLVVLEQMDEGFIFRWRDVWHITRPMLVVLFFFIIHNFFLAPLIVYKDKRKEYFALLLLLMMAFVGCQCTIGRPAKFANTPKLSPADNVDSLFDKKIIEEQAVVEKATSVDQPDSPPPPGRRHLAGPHDFTMFSLLVFALGANLGLKLYFKTQQDQQKDTALEKENLRQELSYLRYQVSPHFLMNTLNNIHALVDIDPEKAKSGIVKLSRLMRYLLYDSEKKISSLQEVISMTHYHINLMRLRYNDKVVIDFEEPDEVPPVGMAPLIIIPFLENAFKHGVSYDKPSYIRLVFSVEDNGQTIQFVCVNSKNNTQHEQGGIGMTNVIKRLNLIYGERHHLYIDEDADEYRVKLLVPAEKMNIPTSQNPKNNNLKS